MPNLSLPGNPRYQPKDLTHSFGYDNLASFMVEVVLAALKTLAEMGVVKAEDYALLTPEVEKKLLAITTTEVDKVEREVTKHDVRALVWIMQQILPEPLRRWVYVPLTSYDVLDTARMIQFVRAYKFVLKGKISLLVDKLAQQAMQHAQMVQIGRTHGQHALPITVGFWLATILNRVVTNAVELRRYADGLVGKISGAVGAHNAQVGLRIDGRGGIDFEKRVLEHLGLNPAPISTQILPPEPLAYFLFAALCLCASLGQLGRDGRHLMRSEIGELFEPFEEGQVGSSTMAQKRNPINFENLEGTWLKTRNEFGKVLDTMISDHQRDLVGSTVSRDFPTIIVNVTSQLDTLLRENKHGEPFISRLRVSEEACKRNLRLQGDSILAEPIYLALQMHGYPGDAHKVVNHRAMPLVAERKISLVSAIEILSESDPVLRAAWVNIPPELHALFLDSASYIGRAREKTIKTVDRAYAALGM